MINELDEAWEKRHEIGNSLPHVFGRSIVGSIDTFPILINRPSKNNLQRLFYNGKYASHVVKVSVFNRIVRQNANFSATNDDK